MYRPEQRGPSLVTPGKVDVWIRHTPIPQFPLIGVSLAVVFEGESASQAAELHWDRVMRHHEEATKDRPTRHKLYFTAIPKGSVGDLWGVLEYDLYSESTMFELSELAGAVRWEWQLMRRPNQGAKAFCARLSEIEKFERGEIKSWAWGFGRPHAFNPGFRTSQHFAGPVEDYPPGTTVRGVEWKGFEPVILKAGRPPGAPVTLRLKSSWTGGRDIGFFVETLFEANVHPLIRSEEFVDQHRSSFSQNHGPVRGRW